MNPLKYVMSYATFSEIFGQKQDRKELAGLIHQLPYGGVLNVISQMLSRPVDDQVIRERFLTYLRARNLPRQGIERISKGLEGRALTFPQGLMTVFKWLLAYGDPRRYREPIDLDRAVSTATYLCLIVADYLEPQNSEEHPVEYRFAQLSALGTTSDLGSDIARAGRIFVDLAQKHDLYSPKEFVEFGTEFAAKYGCTITDFLAIIFGLEVSFGIGPHTIGFDWVRNADEVFSATALAPVAGRVVREHLLLTLQEARTWALATIDDPFDFTKFQERPFLEVEPGRSFFPVAPRFLQEQIFSGLYHRLRHCYPTSDTRFIQFFGRPFEEYVKALVHHSVSDSPLPYDLRLEFSFGKGGMNRSPEALLRLGNSLLAIEAKALRMNLDGLLRGNREVIDKDHYRMVTKPLKQLQSALVNMKNSTDALKGIENIHLMVVTMGDFPTLKPFEHKTRAELASFGLPIQGFYHLDIEEFELFCSLLGRRRPVFRVLENKTRLGANMGFKNFVFASKLPSRRSAFATGSFDVITRQIQRALFPKP